MPTAGEVANFIHNYQANPSTGGTFSSGGGTPAPAPSTGGGGNSGGSSGGGSSTPTNASVLAPFITPGKEAQAETIANNAGYTINPANTGGASPVPATVATPPATIVTSTQSQNTYANNQNTINTALTALKQTPATDPSVVNMLNLNKMPSDV